VVAKRESIGERVKCLRLERGISQRDLAEPGISYAYISRIEAGNRQPSEKTLRALAKRLGVTVLYLEMGSDSVRCPHCGRDA
jgi:transcriptional regulator with XRE-family HTH domain